MQKKYFQTKVCCCTVQFCTVRYCTVQGTTPPHKSDFFFFAFLDESGHFQCFPKAFRKNPKKSKKKFGIGPDLFTETLDPTIFLLYLNSFLARYIVKIVSQVNNGLCTTVHLCLPWREFLKVNLPAKMTSILKKWQDYF